MRSTPSCDTALYAVLPALEPIHPFAGLGVVSLAMHVAQLMLFNHAVGLQSFEARTSGAVSSSMWDMEQGPVGSEWGSHRLVTKRAGAQDILKWQAYREIFAWRAHTQEGTYWSA